MISISMIVRYIFTYLLVISWMSQFFQTTKKWGAYDDGDFTFLEEGFVHYHPVEFDFRYRSGQSRVQIQQTLRNSESGVASHGEVKFELPLASNQSSKLYSRLTSNGKFTLQYDNGLLQLTSGTKLNFFSAFQSNRTFSSNVYKLGLSCIGESYNYGFRFRYETEAGKNYLVAHLRGGNSGEWHHGKWKFNFFNIYDPSLSRFIKNGILLGLFLDGKGEDSIFLRAESGKKKTKGLHWCELFTQLKLNYTKNINPTTKVGVQTKFNLANRDSLWNHTYLGAEWRFPESNTTFKAKITPSLTSAFAITHELVNLGKYSLGMELLELGKLNSLRFGTRISLNL